MDWLIYGSESLADIFVHLALICTFIIIFFFTYASYIEKTVIQNETSDIVEQISRQISIILTKEQNDELRTYFKNMQVPDMSAADKNVKDSNDLLLNKSIIFLSIFVASCFIIVLDLFLLTGFSIRSLLLHNLIALFSVAAVDFTFLTVFAKNYKPSDSSYVKTRLLVVLRDWTQQHK